MTTSVIIKNVRLSYMFHNKPRVTKNGKVWQTAIIIPKNHPQVGEIQQAIKLERDTKWPDPAKRPNGLRNPLRDADAEAKANEKEVEPAYAGAYFLNANRYEEAGPPTLIDASMKPVTQPERWNSGDYANVKVDFFPYHKDENKGIGCGLVTIMFLRKGEPLTGRTDPMAGFQVEEDLSKLQPEGKAVEDFWN